MSKERTETGSTLSLTDRNAGSFEINDLYITKGTDKIFCRVYSPKTAKKVPLVIFSHELGATYVSGIPYGEALAKEGIALVTFDFRNGSPNSLSGNDMTKMTPMTEADDLKAVLHEVSHWGFINTGKIVLLGASHGCFASIVTAIAAQAQLAGLILLYPGLVFLDDFHRQYKSLNEVPETFLFHDSFTFGRPYVESVWNYDIYSEMRKFTSPVLILHGDADPWVPMEYADRVAGSFPKAKKVVVPGGEHGFSGKTLGFAIDQIRLFLDNSI